MFQLKLTKLLFVSAFVFGTFAQAQQGPIAVGQQSVQAVAKPAHGQSMAAVEANFGAPVEKAPAVGEPPITRWKYAEFTVYFEHDKVIHSVAHRQ